MVPPASTLSPTDPATGASDTLVLGEAVVRLLPERAVWLPAARALLVADVHLGKAETFRSLGVPVPGGIGEATLARLDALIRAHRPRQVLVLGDLLHGPAAQCGSVLEPLARWRGRHAEVAVALVRGNHDDRAGDPPAECGIALLDEPAWLAELPDLALAHAPSFGGSARMPAAPAAGGPCIAGHLHPVLTLRGRADRARVHCFWRRGDTLVLPAFGGFTGGFAVAPQPGDALWITDGARVHRVPARTGTIEGRG